MCKHKQVLAGQQQSHYRESSLPSAFHTYTHPCTPLHLKVGTRDSGRRPDSLVSAQQFLPLNNKNLCPIEPIAHLPRPFSHYNFLPFCFSGSLLTYTKILWKIFVTNISRAELLTPASPCPASIELLKKQKCRCPTGTGMTDVIHPPRTPWLTIT